MAALGEIADAVGESGEFKMDPNDFELTEKLGRGRMGPSTRASTRHHPRRL